MADERDDFAVVRVQRNGGSALPDKERLGEGLHLMVERQVQVVPADGRPILLAVLVGFHLPTAHVHQHKLASLLAAQALLVEVLQPGLPDAIALPVSVAAERFQRPGVDLANIAESVCGLRLGVVPATLVNLVGDPRQLVQMLLHAAEGVERNLKEGAARLKRAPVAGLLQFALHRRICHAEKVR